MSLASAVANAARGALKKFGAPATLARTAPGAYDPGTGAVVGVTTTYPVNALLDATHLQSLGFQFGEGLVQAGDIKATIAGVKPQLGDVLTVGGTAYTVKAVRPSYVMATEVTWECLVTK